MLRQLNRFSGRQNGYTDRRTIWCAPVGARPCRAFLKSHTSRLQPKQRSAIHAKTSTKANRRGYLPSCRYNGASPLRRTQCLLKYCTSRSCCLACSREEKVPRLRRLPVAASFLREYKRNCPDLSLRIMPDIDAGTTRRVAQCGLVQSRPGFTEQ